MAGFKTIRLLRRIFAGRRKPYRCSSRLVRLSMPLERRQRSKYVKKPRKKQAKSKKMKFRIFSRSKHPSQRTQELSQPPLRFVMENREQFGMILPDKVKHNLDNVINKEIKKAIKQAKKRRSDRAQALADALACPYPKKVPWTKEQREKHKKWLERNAAPKQWPEEKGPYRGRTKPLDDMVRTVELAKPKFIIYDELNPYMDANEKLHYVKVSALMYRASDNIKSMAKPLRDHEKEDYNSYFAVKKSALRNIKLSSRLLEISKPKLVDVGEYILDKGNVAQLGTVKPSALKYNASKRIKEISRPKPQPPKENLDDVFKVKPNALKASCSAHLVKLATPKIVTKLP